MKRLLILLALVISLTGMAQSGFYEGRYYNQQYSVQDVCGATYTVWSGYYDYYGRPIYYGYQNCQRARWYSYSGYNTGYYWNGSSWYSRYEYRTWYYYDWVNYTRRVY